MRQFRNLPNTARKGTRLRQRKLGLESLEQRHLLTGTPVITEFLAINDSLSPDEDGEFSDWIEIHNPDSTAIDLTGWHLTDDESQLTRWEFPSVSLAPDEYLLVRASGLDRLGDGPQGELHTDFRLSGDGEYLALVAPDGETAVQEFVADAGQFPAQVADVSYGLVPETGRETYFLSPTPGARNSGTTSDNPRQQIVINEIMYHPASLLDSEEYVELYNAGDEAVDLAGWEFTSGVAYTFPVGATLGSGDFVVVAADPATFFVKYPAVPSSRVYGGWEGRLSNSSETIELSDASGDMVDQVTYADEGDWGRRVAGALDGCCRGWDWDAAHDAGGSALELINVEMSNDYGQNWTSGAVDGSPGAPNSVQSSNTAPIILDVHQSNPIPGSSDTVTVRATLLDASSSDSLTAQLFYRIDNSGNPEEPSPFILLPMFDDGAHDDNHRGDGVFAATIPALPDQSVVEFFVLANDAEFNFRSWPAAATQADGSVAQTANALYQVNDDFNGAYSPGDQPTIFIVMTEAERSLRETITTSNAEMNATVIRFDGTGAEVRYTAGVRNRGNSSRTNSPRNHRINIPSDQPLDGVDAIAINAVNTHTQLLGSVIFQAAGVVSENARAVQLRINGENLATGSSMSGSYVQLEVPNTDFAENHFPNDSGGNVYSVRKIGGGGALANLRYEGDDPDTYRDRYQKTTNEDADDFSDLIGLLDALNNSSDETFFAELSARVDLDQWFRYFATDALLINTEGGLATGGGDDYSLYRGNEDTRFVLIPHDLDSLLNRGNGPSGTARNPFIYEEVPGLARLFSHPETASLYYKHLLELTQTVFSDETFGNYVDQVLGSWVSDDIVANYKRSASLRRDFIVSQIPTSLTVETQLPMVGDRQILQTSDDGAVLSGNSHAANTRSVMVNGHEAIWIPRLAIWAIPDLPLNTGLNRIQIEAFDGPDGTGNLIDVTSIDIWSQQNELTEVTTIGPGEVVWESANGPYHVTEDLLVPSGSTLTIEPGTSVFFDEQVELRVEGTLIASGTEHNRIRFSSLPGADFVPDRPVGPGLPDGPPRWAGIHFVETMDDANVIAYADIEFAQDNASNQGSVGVIRSQAVLDNLTFAGTHLRVLYGVSPSWIVSNSVFPSLFAEDEFSDALNLSNNVSEQIKTIGEVPEGGRYIVRNNVFGTTKGHNDIIDADSGRRSDGDAIVQIVDNIFTGSGDEHLDLGGDVYVSGNLFMNIFKDDETSDRGYANAISTGDAGADTTTGVFRNIFWDVDHAINLKRDAATLFENNTVVAVHPDFVDVHGNPNVGSAINLYVDEPGATTGEGAYVSGNIFWNAPRIFGNADSAGSMSHLQLIHNFIDPLLAATTVGDRPGTILDLGTGNVLDAVHFVDEANGEFQLADGSPARATAPFGMDFGALVPAGAWVAGAPTTVTNATNIELTIGGPGIMAYRYRIDGQSWSDAISIGDGYNFDDPEQTVRTATLALSGLANGTHTVDVVGLDFGGNWQEFADATSVSWTIDTINPLPFDVVISEVLARNETTVDLDGTRPDAIELYNRGVVAVDLGGYALSDDSARPDRFVFPVGTMLGAGEYLVVYADNASPVAGEIHVGFGLKNEGEDVFLFDWAGQVAGQPPELIDSVEFGSQLSDRSIARLPDGTWGLAVPTLGEANIAQPIGSANDVVINEWFTSGSYEFDEQSGNDDFIELHNFGSLPAAIGDLYLTDDAIGDPARHRITPLSFIEAGGFTVFEADGNADRGADHVDFRLADERGWIALLDEEFATLDLVYYGPQTPGVSQGRLPDGGATYAFMQPSPGATAIETADFDRNGAVELADYELWIATFGDEVAIGAAADGNRNGVIDAADFTVWRDEYDLLLANVEEVVSPYHNFRRPENVDGDTGNIVSAIDALLIVNELGDRVFSDAVTGRLYDLDTLDVDADPEFFDVNNDGIVSPIDAIRVINAIPRRIAKPALSSAAENLTESDASSSRLESESLTPQIGTSWMDELDEEEDE